MEMIKFGADDLDNRLASDPSRAELLPFGAILLNQQGDVLRFNRAESFISGREPGDVVGKNFFNDIAPCTSRVMPRSAKMGMRFRLSSSHGMTRS